MKLKGISNELNRQPWPLLWNMLLVFICYTLCRIEFVMEDWDLFEPTFEWSDAWKLFCGGLRFDASAIAYTNALYILLALFPWHKKEHSGYYKLLKWLFIVVNALAIAINLCDSVYFPFTQQRTTAMFFTEFRNNDNLGSIFAIEVVRHWYLVLMEVVLVVFMIKMYRNPTAVVDEKNLKSYYVHQSLSLIIVGLFSVCGMRGVFIGTSSRPISINEAYRYTDVPELTAIPLNTPFAIIRTLNERPMQTPEFFKSQAELDKVYSPVHYPRPDRVVRRKNICILIVESFAEEFIGSLNKELDNGTYKGYTPFADELLSKSLTWKETYANGAMSIDAMPAVLASIPRMGKPFVLTPYSLNNIDGIAGLLNRWGYSSAFFHGAKNGSMGFEAFASSAGFNRYYGMTEYCKDKRFGGKNDYDGTWGIWDEPFLQYYATKIGEMNEPFITTVFTLSSHHPFKIPEQYRDTFPDEGKYALHKCIRYTDYSLRRFFQTASRQPWYKNTIFVLCADHASSKRTHQVYMNEVGDFRIPIIFFDPTGELGTGVRDGIAQQIDIMPTLLAYLGYDKPYVAFGIDLMHTAPQDTWAMNWDHVPQFIQGGHSLLFDGNDKVMGFYDFHHDPYMKRNIKGNSREQTVMLRHLEAIIQSYMQRMRDNKLVLKQ